MVRANNIKHFHSCYLLTAALILVSLLNTAHAQSGKSIPQDRSSAVIFSYQRVGEDQNPDTSIRTAQFEAQIRELLSGPYHIAPLPEIIAALKSGSPLPPHTVALTFNGAYKSIMMHAVPLLLEHDIPFTLFIPTDHLDSQTPDIIDWETLKRLKRNKRVTIGLHPARYERLMGESESEIRRQINKARTRYRDVLEEEPEFFAYPFGEYSATYKTIIKEQGFKAAFGQQSGLAYSGADCLALPRFSMTEHYAGLERFRLTAHALPLPAQDITPKDPYLSSNNPAIGFTLSPALAETLDKMSCFVSGQEPPEIVFAGRNRVELRIEKPFEDSRIRINCTMPGPAPDPDEENETPRWRWLGLLLSLPQDIIR